MNEHTQKLLDKSLDVLEAAEVLLTSGKTDVAAGRTYYSMMHRGTVIEVDTTDFSKVDYQGILKRVKALLAT